MIIVFEGYVMVEFILFYVCSVLVFGFIVKMEIFVRFKSVYFVILISKKIERGKNVKYMYKCVCWLGFLIKVGI